MSRLGSVLVFFAVTLILILSAPILFESVLFGVNNTGSATGFFISLIPFAMLFTLVLVGIGLFRGFRDDVRRFR